MKRGGKKLRYVSFVFKLWARPFFFLLHRSAVSKVPMPGAREMGKSRVEAGSFLPCT